MRKIYLLVLLCAFSAIVTGVPVEISNDPFFLNAQYSTPGQFPSLVSIETPIQDLCAGVIIDQFHVLTSCQCVLNNQQETINPAWLRIIAGDINIVMPTYRRFVTNVTHIFPHEWYNPFTHENDLTVLRVGQPFPLPHNTIEPIIRNQRVIGDNQQCQLPGWSFMPTQVDQVPTLSAQHFANIHILNRHLCINIEEHSAAIADSMMCASLPPLSSDDAPFNIGGGLFCNNQLSGILSLQRNFSTIIRSASIFTQVRFFEPWIQQQLIFTDTPLIAP